MEAVLVYGTVLAAVKRPNTIDVQKHIFLKSWLTKKIKKHIPCLWKVESLARHKGFENLKELNLHA